MASIFGETKFFWKIGMATLHRYPVDKKIHRNLSISQFLRYKHFLYVAMFVKNSKIQNGRHFWQDFFAKLGWLFRRDTPWIKNIIEIALSSTVFEI